MTPALVRKGDVLQRSTTAGELPWSLPARKYSRQPSIQIQDALRHFFRPTRTGDSKTDFYFAYQKEATEYDHFVEQYDEYLNTSLIFVSSSHLRLMPLNNPIARLVFFPLSVQHSSSNYSGSWNQTKRHTSKRFSKRFKTPIRPSLHPHLWQDHRRLA